MTALRILFGCLLATIGLLLSAAAIQWTTILWTRGQLDGMRPAIAVVGLLISGTIFVTGLTVVRFKPPKS